jgi:hypothetical protein
MATGMLFGFALSIVLMPILEEVTGQLLSRLQLARQVINVRATPFVPNLSNLQSELNQRNLSNHNLQSELNQRHLSNHNLQSELNQRHLRNHKTTIDNPQRTPYATKTR